MAHGKIGARHGGIGYGVGTGYGRGIGAPYNGGAIARNGAYGGYGNGLGYGGPGYNAGPGYVAGPGPLNNGPGYDNDWEDADVVIENEIEGLGGLTVGVEKADEPTKVEATDAVESHAAKEEGCPLAAAMAEPACDLMAKLETVTLEVPCGLQGSEKEADGGCTLDILEEDLSPHLTLDDLPAIAIPKDLVIPASDCGCPLAAKAKADAKKDTKKDDKKKDDKKKDTKKVDKPKEIDMSAFALELETIQQPQELSFDFSSTPVEIQQPEEFAFDFSAPPQGVPGFTENGDLQDNGALGDALW